MLRTDRIHKRPIWKTDLINIWRLRIKHNNLLTSDVFSQLTCINKWGITTDHHCQPEVKTNRPNESDFHSSKMLFWPQCVSIRPLSLSASVVVNRFINTALPRNRSLSIVPIVFFSEFFRFWSRTPTLRAGWLKNKKKYYIIPDFDEHLELHITFYVFF